MKKCNKSENPNKKYTCSGHIIHRKTIGPDKKGRKHFYLKKEKYQCNTKSNNKMRVDPTQYVFYVILNTKLRMDQGTAAALVARSILKLHNRLDSSNTNGVYIDKWTDSGETIILLEGYDHNHLKYLKEEAKYAAIDTYTLYEQRSHCRVIVVLSVFGLEQHLEDIFEGLDTLV